MKRCNTWEEVIIGQKPTHQFIFHIDMTECSWDFKRKLLIHFNKKKTKAVTEPYLLGLYNDSIYFQMTNIGFRKVFKNLIKQSLEMMAYDFEINDNQEYLKVKNR